MANECHAETALPCLPGSYDTDISQSKTVGRLVRDVRSQERADMRNRLLSIGMDAKFVSELVAAYRRNACSYPVFANLRNGLWYGRDWDGACYFKSTDGHSRRWSFSYTRLNIHLAAAAAASGGCILIDSTRTGKRFPDSFTATVPIWCCVLNRLAAPEEDACRVSDDASDACEHGGGAPVRGRERDTTAAWDTALHTPRWLSASEASQIEERMPKWLDGIGGAREALSKRLRSFLKKPLRAVWLSPESRLVEGMLPACPPSDLAFTPVICVSASKVISPERHREHHSWTYLQGAGDDEEHWSSGLTPETFWENYKRLVELAEGGDTSCFESAVAALLAGKKIRGSSSSHVANSSGRRSEPHDEPTSAAMSTSAAHVLGQSVSAGSGSPSGSEGVDEGGGDAWQPGGQELHAVLGNTGLAIASLAFAARNWARLGSDCSLLNLSDEPFPESFVKNLTSPTRRYLHIPLKAGKKANPPKYWKTKVFPAALTFIATAIGKAPPRQQDASPTVGTQGSVSSSPACRTSVSASVSTRNGARTTAGPAVSFLPACQNSVSGSKDGMRNTAESAVSPPPACKTSVSGSASGQDGGRNEEEAAGGTGRGSHKEDALGGAIARGPEPPRSFDQPPSATTLAGRVEISSTRPASPPQRRHPRRCALSRGGAAGKCLVACPTGAEASVVVCLSALAAFFPPPPESISDRGAPAAREDRLRLRSARQASATLENCATPEDGASPEKRATPENRVTPENHETPESTTTEKTHATQGNRATAAVVAGECKTETSKEEPGLQLERDGFAVLRRGAGVVTKPQLRWRFLLLQQECPWARPPRRLMQELNEYFMSPGEHSWWSLSDHLLLFGGSNCEAGADTRKTDVADCPGVSVDCPEASVACPIVQGSP